MSEAKGVEEKRDIHSLDLAARLNEQDRERKRASRSSRNMPTTCSRNEKERAT